jgi:hypothetical protein
MYLAAVTTVVSAEERVVIGDAQGNLMPNPNPSQATPNGATDDLSNSVFLIIVMLVANPGRLNHRASV